MRPFKKKPAPDAQRESQSRHGDNRGPVRPEGPKNPSSPKSNYAFIDSQNLNLGVQKMGWKMDWKKFREWLKAEYDVDKAFMFIGYMPDFEKLYDQLHSQGYLVVLKPTIEMFMPTESERAEKAEAAAKEEKKPELGPEKAEKVEEKHKPKGNVDTDLVLHVMKEFKNYDKAVIVSGDGDFYTLIEYLDQENKLLKVLTPNWQYSSLLKPFEKYIVRLDQKRNELRYYDHRKRPYNKKPA